MKVKEDKPYGHLAVIEVYKPGGNFWFNEKERKSIRRKGTRQAVESAAKSTPRLAEIISVEALNKTQWINAFGTGSER